MGKTKLNIPMLAALILLLLTMVSTHFTSGLYARYSSTATGTDTARVAAFKVTGTVAAVEGKPGEFEVTVNNESEVTVNYSLEVVLDPHLSVTIGSDKKQLKADETSVTFTNTDWKLAPNTTTQEPITMVVAVENWVGLTDSKNDEGDYKEVKLNFTVNVVAEQVD